MRNRRVVAVAILAVGMAACNVVAGDSKKHEPTEVEALRLSGLQKDALIAKIGLEQAQQNFNAKLKALTDEADKVKAAHKWGDDIAFDPNDVSFKPKSALPPAQGAPPVPVKK